MIRILSLLFLTTISSWTFAQGTITTPRTPSPAASVSQTIGISKVTVDYSRPSVKGREIWGKIVPYGWNVQPFGAQNSAPWRAGANENTVITFTHEATVEGKKVPAGSYALFYVINEDNTGEVILSKEHRAWGSFWYDEANDQMRADITIKDGEPCELLTYEFANLDKNSGELLLKWEKKQFPVKIEFAVDDIVMENATAELTNTKGFTPQGYSSAANYALQNKTHIDQGMKWVENALAGNRNFTNLNIKSGLLTELGKTEEAKKVMEEAMTVATEAELNNYGYQLLNDGNKDEAIRIFTLNTERFPKSANAWDSLGEGYALNGDKKNAIKNFKKSLTLNPAENVKANSEKYLKELGAL